MIDNILTANYSVDVPFIKDSTGQPKVKCDVPNERPFPNSKYIDHSVHPIIIGRLNLKS